MCRLIKQKLESMQLNLCQTEVKINKLKLKTSMTVQRYFFEDAKMRPRGRYWSGCARTELEIKRG